MHSNQALRHPSSRSSADAEAKCPSRNTPGSSTCHPKDALTIYIYDSRFCNRKLPVPEIQHRIAQPLYSYHIANSDKSPCSLHLVRPVLCAPRADLRRNASLSRPSLCRLLAGPVLCVFSTDLCNQSVDQLPTPLIPATCTVRILSFML